MAVSGTSCNISSLSLKFFFQFIYPGKVLFLLLFDNLLSDILLAKELSQRPEPAVRLYYSVGRSGLNLRNTEILFKHCSKIASQCGACLNRGSRLGCVVQILQG